MRNFLSNQWTGAAVGALLGGVLLVVLLFGCQTVPSDEPDTFLVQEAVKVASCFVFANNPDEGLIVEECVPILIAQVEAADNMYEMDATLVIRYLIRQFGDEVEPIFIEEIVTILTHYWSISDVLPSETELLNDEDRAYLLAFLRGLYQGAVRAREGYCDND